MSFSLYQKYRPKNFSEITGQEHIVRTLSNSIKNDRLGHAYLFTGSRGIGKTTLARIFAKAVNCLAPQIKKLENQKASFEPCGQCENCRLISENRTLDLIEIDAASHTGVDNIRQLKENAQIPPSGLKYKVYIIDEVHMLSIGAFNALLKTLEEPPRHTIFILATTEIHKIPETIISRCQRFDFRRLNLQQIVKRLEQISEKESVKTEPAALELIALQAEGGMRDAESLLGQIISIEDKEITEKEVSAIIGSSSKKLTFEFTSYFLERDIKKTLEKIADFQSSGMSFKNVQKTVLAFLRDILLIKANPQKVEEIALSSAPEQKNKMLELAEKISFKDLIFSLELLQKNLSLFKETSLPQLPLELSCIEFYLADQPAVVHSSPPLLSNKKINLNPDKENKPFKNQVKNKIIKTDKISLEQKKPALKEEKNDSVSAKPVNELGNILDKWSAIIEGVKPYNHSINAFLKNCVPIAVDKGRLLIKTKYDFYKERLNEANNQLTIKKVVDKIAKCDLKILILTEKELQQMNFKANDSNNNPNILHDAMKMMGGKIID